MSNTPHHRAEATLQWRCLSALLAATALFTACGGGSSPETSVASGGASAPTASVPAPAASSDSPVPPESSGSAPSPVVVEPQVPSTRMSYQSTPGEGTRASVGSGSLTLAGALLTDGTQEVVLKGSSATLRVLSNAGGTLIITDSDTGIKLVSESGPKGTVLRTYDVSARFVSGAFIDSDSTGQRQLWRLLRDGGTDPSNLADGRPFRSTDVQTAASNPTQARIASTRHMTEEITCYDMLSAITGNARAIGDAGKAMELAGDGIDSVERVGKVAQFVSSVWKRIPSLCPDAPDPATDAAFERATVLEAIAAIDDGVVGSSLSRYNDYTEYWERVTAAAGKLQEKLKALPDALRRSTGTASQEPVTLADFDFTDHPQSTIEETTQLAAPALVYISGSLSCVRGRVISAGASSQVEFTNNCGSVAKVRWCFSDGAFCALSSEALVATASTYNTAFPIDLNTVYYAACPAIYEGRSVQLANGDTVGTFTCSYWSR